MPRDEELLASLRIEPATDGFTASGFDCGEEDLTAYICDGTSAGDQLAGVSRSYLVLTPDDAIAGYFTLSADSIRLKPKERPKNVRYSNAPAIKLGRMGVSLTYKRRGVATWILDNVVGLAQELSERVGIRYVTLDSLRSSKPLYDKYGFRRNLEESLIEKVRRKLPSVEELPHISMRFDIRF